MRRYSAPEAVSSTIPIEIVNFFGNGDALGSQSIYKYTSHSRSSQANC